jgi:hypothetical protein
MGVIAGPELALGAPQGPCTGPYDWAMRDGDRTVPVGAP